MCYRGNNYFGEITSRFYADLNKWPCASKKAMTSYLFNT